jgi:hypothetical protein
VIEPKLAKTPNHLPNGLGLQLLMCVRSLQSKHGSIVRFENIGLVLTTGRESRTNAFHRWLAHKSRTATCRSHKSFSGRSLAPT